MDLFEFPNEDHVSKKRKARIAKRKKKRATRKAKRVTRRKEKGGILKRAGGAIKRAAKKVGGAIKKTVGAVAIAPLLPFKGAMKKALQKRGVSTKGMKLKDIVVQFYNHVISKKGRKGSHYEEVNVNDWINDESFFTPYDEEDSLDNQVGATVAMVVNAIIGFFKKAKDKREAAKKGGMTEEEFRAAVPEEEYVAGKEAERVTKELELKEKESQAVRKVDFKKYAIYGVIIAAIGLVLYFAFKKK